MLATLTDETDTLVFILYIFNSHKQVRCDYDALPVMNVLWVLCQIQSVAKSWHEDCTVLELLELNTGEGGETEILSDSVTLFLFTVTAIHVQMSQMIVTCS